MEFDKLEEYNKLDRQHKQMVDYYIDLLLMNQEREEEILTELCGEIGKTETQFTEDYPRQVMKIHDPEYPVEY